MSETDWSPIIDIVEKHVFFIETPEGQGTGFLVKSRPGSKKYCAVTAWHVISHAVKWREPIQLTHFSSKKTIFLPPISRQIGRSEKYDLAYIEFDSDPSSIPPDRLMLNPIQTRLPYGVQTGWLGFPSIAPSHLCFFCGHISTWLADEQAYLVDGVAINGVSGGPAFRIWSKNDTDILPILIGIVTAYIPNTATGVPLPGVSLIRSIDPFVTLDYLQQKTLDSKQEPEPEGSGSDSSK